MRILSLALTLAACGPRHAPVAPSLPATTTWAITPARVGPVTLGEPLPALWSGDAADHYVARYIADGVAYEGFQLDAPAIQIGVADGPFHDHVARRGFAEPPLARLAAKAARAVPTLIVASVRVTDPSVRTAADTGVGSTLAALHEAHGGATLRAMPPTLDDDRCMVSVPDLAEVWFVFTSCEAAEEGAPAHRVDVVRP